MSGVGGMESEYVSTTTNLNSLLTHTGTSTTGENTLPTGWSWNAILNEWNFNFHKVACNDWEVKKYSARDHQETMNQTIIWLNYYI